MIGKLQTSGLIIIAVLFAMVGLYSQGRRAGKAAVIQGHQQNTIKAIKESRDVEANIRAMPDNAVRERLLNNWPRD
ncbi:MAG: hypothetical protein KAT62_03705 [Desulfuromonadales bacterium]|nr:hypothetical protein [Desulfuromonadales bacterium]